jgi:hypothetical protein
LPEAQINAKRIAEKGLEEDGQIPVARKQTQFGRRPGQAMCRNGPMGHIFRDLRQDGRLSVYVLMDRIGAVSKRPMPER